VCAGDREPPNDDDQASPLSYRLFSPAATDLVELAYFERRSCVRGYIP